MEATRLTHNLLFVVIVAIVVAASLMATAINRQNYKEELRRLEMRLDTLWQHHDPEALKALRAQEAEN